MRALFVCLAVAVGTSPALGDPLEQRARARLNADAAAGKPLVAHVLVALADNEHQGIVPVPNAIGNGQRPATNLYWGAGYGVRHFFGHRAGWKELAVAPAPSGAVLERTAFRKTIQRGGKDVTAYVIADAYDGARIRDAIVDALEFSAGRGPQAVTIGGAVIQAGGAASVIAYVGHDGLMDFPVPSPPPAAPGKPANATIVLACRSQAYFGEHLHQTGALPLVMTYGLMAPEAYTLEAILQRWFAGESAAEAREAAAVAYDRYQHCGVKGARRLFGADQPAAASDARATSR